MEWFMTLMPEVLDSFYLVNDMLCLGYETARSFQLIIPDARTKWSEGMTQEVRNTGLYSVFWL